MKHKILLATDTSADIGYLLEDLFSILNTSHQKYASAYSPFNAQLEKLTVSSTRQSEYQGLGGQLIRIEDQLRLEEKARAFNIELDIINNLKNFTQLARLSKICDLLVWDQSAFKEADLDVLIETLDAVECSVLLLPENWSVKSLVLPYDNSKEAISMVKNFLSLFNKELRNQPLSVMVTYPEDMGQVEGEKVFIDYLKLFFDNIGIQLMPDSITSCLEYSAVCDCHDPFLLINKRDAGRDELVVIRRQSRPVFIYKG